MGNTNCCRRNAYTRASVHDDETSVVATVSKTQDRKAVRFQNVGAWFNSGNDQLASNKFVMAGYQWTIVLHEDAHDSCIRLSLVAGSATKRFKARVGLLLPVEYCPCGPVYCRCDRNCGDCFYDQRPERRCGILALCGLEHGCGGCCCITTKPMSLEDWPPASKMSMAEFGPDGGMAQVDLQPHGRLKQLDDVRVMVWIEMYDGKSQVFVVPTGVDESKFEVGDLDPYEDKTWCDATLDLADEEKTCIPIHAAIVSQHSSVLKALLQRELELHGGVAYDAQDEPRNKPKSSNLILNDEKDARIAKLWIKAAYAHEVLPESYEDAVELLVRADRWQLRKLGLACVLYIRDKSTAEQALTLAPMITTLVAPGSALARQLLAAIAHAIHRHSDTLAVMVPTEQNSLDSCTKDTQSPSDSLDLP